jgi:hypothetical protein
MAHPEKSGVSRWDFCVVVQKVLAIMNPPLLLPAAGEHRDRHTAAF